MVLRLAITTPLNNLSAALASVFVTYAYLQAGTQVGIGWALLIGLLLVIALIAGSFLQSKAQTGLIAEVKTSRETLILQVNQLTSDRNRLQDQINGLQRENYTLKNALEESEKENSRLKEENYRLRDGHSKNPGGRG